MTDDPKTVFLFLWDYFVRLRVIDNILDIIKGIFTCTFAFPMSYILVIRSIIIICSRHSFDARH